MLTLCQSSGLLASALPNRQSLTKSRWRLDNNPAVARFLTVEERKWAVERLRSNNTGVETSEPLSLRALASLNGPPA